ncbi:MULTISPECIES: ATP-binding protein [unclassified Parabacteroides]|jgi:serine/threonine-protein kinase RsbW|uniref:ATP-binding protein n=1 Tax=unclassified Parabacteroides TaxID=2649774 RepID=UPI000F002FB5|nr:MULTISPECIES: ATP-binding protein [unclassified Parabacteroides]RHO66023.1 ATP-binding protein [Parabacteroides sp. AF48-14]RHR53679.1 ATP-binding protein [Parabacteroides sp. AF17-28]
MTNTLIIKNELEQLTRLYAFLDRQAVAYGLEELQLMQVKLALEEAVTNVILYAYPDKKDQDIRIDMSYENKRLTIVITDTGTDFNPLERQEPDLTLSLEERPIGGLGIYLVKQLMTEVTYSRSAGKNILTMTKDMH